MSDPRYVIADDQWDGSIVHVLDLPAAEHIHVTRHSDGTITATAMERHRIIGGTISTTREPRWSWVDCPTGGDQ